MRWVCDFCGYVHDDGKPPEMCPVCGGPKGAFIERYGDDDDQLEDEYAGEEPNISDDYYGEYDD